ncbi:MAG: divalent cation tolerance protein CutA [Thermoplasmata archaeon]
MIEYRVSSFEEIEKEVKNLHPYETPEIVGHEIIIGNEDYLEWMDKNLR